MNYCVAAFAIVLVVSVVQWFVDGRKNYTGPRLDVEALKKGEIVGMAPVDSNAAAPDAGLTGVTSRDKKVKPAV